MCIRDSELDTAGFSVGCGRFQCFGTLAKTLRLGATIWTLFNANDTTPWTGIDATVTVIAGTSLIRILSASTNNATFTGGGKQYYDLFIASGGTGIIFINGTNSWNTITINAPKSVRFQASNTQTFTGTLVATGSAGNVIDLRSTTAGTRATLSKASGIVSCDYLTLQDLNAVGGALWYAGANTPDPGSTSGWIFAAAPQGLFPVGVASTALLGVPALGIFRAPVTLRPVGLTTVTGMGAPHLLWRLTLRPFGVASLAALNAPALSLRRVVRPPSVNPAQALGVPAITQRFFLQPLGVATGTALGNPRFITALLHAIGIASDPAVGVPRIRPVSYTHLTLPTILRV